MKKLIAILMLASFAAAALPVSAQTSTPAPAATTPAASGDSKKSEKKHNKKHKKESKGKTEPKTN